MDTATLRQRFLDFFESRGHKVVASAPLVPGNDPSLLFTNAGMVQFKDVFLGSEKRSYKTAVSAQRCVRAGGKHNDLENVGYTARHHTFFEMLGNFSFGDYFKEEAIAYAWEFLTKELGLPPERLWVTVFEDDDEAADIWLNKVGIDPERFGRLGEKDNFWAMGDTGPCGPCSEIFYDHGPGMGGGPPGSAEEEGDRYVEIWNLVFMQYDRAGDGTLADLPEPSVDTGMGLERIAAVMQGVHSNYDIDVFQALISAVAEVTNCNDLENNSLRVIADHIRSSSFLIAEGVLPSNEGRGYVLRRIIRRALRHGFKLKMEKSFFYRLVDPLIDCMGQAHSELRESRDFIVDQLLKEEEQFGMALSRGMSHFEKAVSLEKLVGSSLEQEYHGHLTGLKTTGTTGTSRYRYDGVIEVDGNRYVFEAKNYRDLNQRHLQNWVQNAATILEDDDRVTKYILAVLWESAHEPSLDEAEKFTKNTGLPIDVVPIRTSSLEVYKEIAGRLAFQLYDTYGFPLDLTMDAARERGFTVDTSGFDEEMTKQRKRAREASSFSAAEAGLQIDATTEFTGYESLEGSGSIVAIYSDGKAVEAIEEGEDARIVLDVTPFYAESGGQVGDTGVLSLSGARFAVTDTQKSGEAHVHVGRLESGRLKVGDHVTAVVDPRARSATVLNHSATHLLHAALRLVLGSHVTQKGSLVEPDRLRFDFSHYEAVTDAELAEIEALVNSQIRANTPAETSLMNYDEALESGAVALFGEKYGDEVRVLKLGDFSVELCGGTHVERTGDIGLFRIVSETGIASGVRRIEAITGDRALAGMTEDAATLAELAELVKGSRGDVADKVRQLVEKNKALEKDLKALRNKQAHSSGQDLAGEAREIGGIQVLAARMDDDTDAGALRETVDRMKDKLGTAVIVLGAATADGKVRLAAGVTKNATDRIRAGDLISEIAGQVGGKGGGRPDFAQAGGSDPAALDQALAGVGPWVESRVN